jgi:hypothetical protein
VRSTSPQISTSACPPGIKPVALQHRKLRGERATHPERVSPGEGDNLLVVEAHTVKDVAEVVGSEGTVGETSSRRALQMDDSE